MRRGQRATTRAPSHAPNIDAAIIEKRVGTSTGMIVVYIKVWTTVGNVWPTFSVPGITRSSTIRKNLKIVVVVAYDPIPRVSKKLVNAPVPSWRKPGKRTRCFDRRFIRLQPAINTRLEEHTSELQSHSF